MTTSYCSPQLSRLGTVAEITHDQSMMVDAVRMSFGLFAVASVPVPTPNGGGNTGPAGPGGGVQGTTDALTPSSTPSNTTPVPTGNGGGNTGATDPGMGDTLNDRNTGSNNGNAGNGNAGNGSLGDAAAGAAGDAVGGKLPFTGLAVMLVAGVGAATAGAGVALRRVVRRA